APVQIAVQLAPPFVLLNKPPNCVPASMVLGVTGSIVKASTVPPYGPRGVHLPASAVRVPARVKAKPTLNTPRLAPHRFQPIHLPLRCPPVEWSSFCSSKPASASSINVLLHSHLLHRVEYRVIHTNVPYCRHAARSPAAYFM